MYIKSILYLFSNNKSDIIKPNNYYYNLILIFFILFFIIINKIITFFYHGIYIVYMVNYNGKVDLMDLVLFLLFFI